MDSNISASRCTSASTYIGFLHFLVRYHLPVYMKQVIYQIGDISNRYMKQVIYRLTDKSF